MNSEKVSHSLSPVFSTAKLRPEDPSTAAVSTNRDAPPRPRVSDTESVFNKC